MKYIQTYRKYGSTEHTDVIGRCHFCMFRTSVLSVLLYVMHVKTI